MSLFRGQGAENVTWLWTLQADGPGTGPIASWWPGGGYVTWVGIEKIGDLFAGMRAYQTLGLVWFDIAQHQGIYHQDWRIENSPAAEAAFRLHVSDLPLAKP